MDGLLVGIALIAGEKAGLVLVCCLQPKHCIVCHR
jgi:hypothetical protein